MIIRKSGRDGGKRGVRGTPSAALGRSYDDDETLTAFLDDAGVHHKRHAPTIKVPTSDENQNHGNQKTIVRMSVSR